MQTPSICVSKDISIVVHSSCAIPSLLSQSLSFSHLFLIESVDHMFWFFFVRKPLYILKIVPLLDSHVLYMLRMSFNTGSSKSIGYFVSHLLKYICSFKYL